MSAIDEGAHLRAADRPNPVGFLDGRDLLERDLLRLWQGRDGNLLDRISHYALVPAGKMLRPLLVLESARCVGGRPEGLARPALALEYLHVSTLVHDDIIDEDDMRRGRPSVQAAFGLASAIVAGDGLLLETFAALTDAPPEDVPAEAVVALVNTTAEAGLSVCRGQLMETELVGDLDCGVERYLAMAGLKTGALFEASCRAGAILGGAPREWIDALGGFGSRLGVAFQIRDDLLAFDGPLALIGKPQESDLHNHRPTLPILLAYQRASAADRERLERAFHEDQPVEKSYAVVSEVLEATGARAAAGEVAAGLIRQAKDRLAALPAGESVLALAEIADYAARRRF
ncbi:polyprenyl synthetase family protein [Actinomadura litoris]|uniref:Polyprenyl synthetase family protein n=1 Tax=Actinomadura litoris TaxID=2678616 RepID=A0A7K1KW45_9ACTN|nr:polyprenyl synthetase family protein [Actinomadura litoris]MUN36176.1 polyprenyl synthetase family protein [Actinomadura litoris]